MIFGCKSGLLLHVKIVQKATKMTQEQQSAFVYNSVTHSLELFLSCFSEENP